MCVCVCYIYLFKCCVQVSSAAVVAYALGPSSESWTCPCLSLQYPTTTLTSPSSALAPWQSKLTSCKRRAPTPPRMTQTGWLPSLSNSSITRASLSPSRFISPKHLHADTDTAAHIKLFLRRLFDHPLVFLPLAARVQFLWQAVWLDGKGHRGHGCQHPERRTSLWKETEGTWLHAEVDVCFEIYPQNQQNTKITVSPFTSISQLIIV